MRRALALVPHGGLIAGNSEQASMSQILAPNMEGICGASERDRTSDLLITSQPAKRFNLLIKR
jgi:hypothetical protein